MADDRLIVALDCSDLKDAINLVQLLGDKVSYYKVGSTLFTAVGPVVLSLLKDCGKKVFLDLKYHDIPNTVAGAIASAVNMGVDMLNVHTLGGKEMMQAAVAAADNKTILLGVTVLTSHNRDVLEHDLGLSGAVHTNVVRLAQSAKDIGLNGVVCSPQEISLLKEACGQDFILVCPGIRPITADIDDQRRVMPPYLAMMEGADYLVVGRPITKASDPIEAVENILTEMSVV